jgi:hypothetical protein
VEVEAALEVLLVLVELAEAETLRCIALQLDLTFQEDLPERLILVEELVVEPLARWDLGQTTLAVLTVVQEL